LSFDSFDVFMAAFLPVFAQLRDDIPNYTNSKPAIQISDVKLSS